MPSPLMPILTSVAALTAIAAFTVAPVVAQAPQQSDFSEVRPETTTIPRGLVKVPFRMVGHMPAVEVLVNGRGPFLFEFDTGGQGLARADTTLVRKLGLEVVGQAQGTDGMGGPGRAMDIVGIDSIEIAGARFTGLSALTRDYNRVPSARSEPIDGILGFGLFADCVVTIDYPSSTLIIEQGRPLRAHDDGVVRYDNSRGAPTIPMTIAGQRVEATLDSGSSGGITVSEELARSLPFSGEPRVVGRARTVVREFDIYEATLDGEVVLAGHTIENPPIGYAEVINHINVGSQVMRHFILSFDQQSSLLRIRRAPGAGPISLEPRSARGAAGGSSGVEVPLLRAGHVPAVMATVNGKGPFLFAVDTGAAGMVHLDAAFVREQGLRITGEEQSADGMTGGAITMDRVDVGEIAIGPVTYTGVTGLSRDYTNVVAALGGEIVGIIGFGMFENDLFTIDYPSDRLVIDRGGALRASEPGVIPIHDGGGIPAIDVGVNGATVRADLDTGSASGLMVPEAVFDTLEFSDNPMVVGMGRSVSASFEIRQATLKGSVRLGATAIEGPSVQTAGPARRSNIGSQLLSGFALTFDQRNGLMRFAQGEGAAPTAAAPSRGRLGIMPAIRGEDVTLQGVLPGSAAEAAGLRAGDRITAVNGKPIAELVPAGLGREMAVRPTVVITVDRDGEELTFSVTLE